MGHSVCLCVISAVDLCQETRAAAAWFFWRVFFPPGVVWNVRDRCVAFYRELDDLVFNLVYL